MKAGRLKLFGPVLFYDLIRIAHRTRFIVVRTLYVLLLAFILGWLYLVLWLRYGGLVPTTVLAEFANYFFYTYMVIQFVVVVLLTPPYTAGAIAEEKERRTLEFLLATDLRDREIVLGKFMARALNLTILLLAGLPILALLQVLGGVDPGLLLAGFAATLLTMFSLAAISILSSVAMRRARDAIVLVYFSFLGYYLLASLALIFQRNFPGGWTNWPGLGNWTSPVTLGDLVEWLNAGNVGYALFQLASRRTILDQALPGVLRDYALFHGLLGMGCLGLAVWRLRRAALREAEHTGPRPSRKRRAGCASIGTMPMLWKEIVAEGSIRLNLLGKIIAGLLVIASFAPVSIILYLYFDGQIRRGWRGGPDWEQAGWEINAFQVRFVGTLVACLLWLAVVVRAAGSISGERDRDTLDNLLTTPLAARDILLAKWLGAILSVRKGWILLAAIWGVGVLTGALQPLCVPLLAGVWLLYAAGLAGVGLWFSATARRTLRHGRRSADGPGAGGRPLAVLRPLLLFPVGPDERRASAEFRLVLEPAVRSDAGPGPGLVRLPRRFGVPASRSRTGHGKDDRLLDLRADLLDRCYRRPVVCGPASLQGGDQPHRRPQAETDLCGAAAAADRKTKRQGDKKTRRQGEGGSVMRASGRLKLFGPVLFYDLIRIAAGPVSSSFALSMFCFWRLSWAGCTWSCGCVTTDWSLRPGWPTLPISSSIPTWPSSSPSWCS